MNKFEGFNNNRKKGIIIVIHFHRNVEMYRRKKEKRKEGRNETPATSLYSSTTKQGWHGIYVLIRKEEQGGKEQDERKGNMSIGKLFKGMRVFEQVGGWT